MGTQLDFDFAKTWEGTDGLAAWREARRAAIERLAAKQGLPLGHHVRVSFRCGPPLEGILVLNEEALFAPQRPDAHLHLRIGSADFHASEIASCIRLDWSAESSV